MIGVKEYIGNFRFRIESLENDVKRLDSYATTGDNENTDLNKKVQAVLEYLDLELVIPSTNSSDWDRGYRAQAKEKK